MAKGMTKRAKQKKQEGIRRRKAAAKARRAWMPKRHTIDGVSYATFLDLPRELRDMIIGPLLTLPKECSILRLSVDPTWPCRWEMARQKRTLDEFFWLSLVNRNLTREVENTLFTVNKVWIFLDSFEQPDDYQTAGGYPKVTDMDIKCELLPGLTNATLARIPKINVQDSVSWLRRLPAVYVPAAFCVTTFTWKEGIENETWLECALNCTAMEVKEDGHIQKAGWKTMVKKLKEMTVGVPGTVKLSMSLLREIVMLGRKLDGLEWLGEQRLCPATYQAASQSASQTAGDGSAQ